MTGRKRTTKANSGSPSTGEPEYLVVGLLRRPHGLHGEMLMDVITDFPERLVPGTEVFLGERHLPVVIASCRPHLKGMLIRFEGEDSPETAGDHRHQNIYVLSSNRPALPDGHYYHHELLGSAVLDDRQLPLGKLTEILQTGANDVYVITTTTGRQLLVPAIDGVVLEIDANNRVIRIRVPEGLELGSENMKLMDDFTRDDPGESGHP